jgi:hypothetical protein
MEYIFYHKILSFNLRVLFLRIFVKLCNSCTVKHLVLKQLLGISWHTHYKRVFGRIWRNTFVRLSGWSSVGCYNLTGLSYFFHCIIIMIIIETRIMSCIVCWTFRVEIWVGLYSVLKTCGPEVYWINWPFYSRNILWRTKWLTVLIIYKLRVTMNCLVYVQEFWNVSIIGHK